MSGFGILFAECDCYAMFAYYRRCMSGSWQVTPLALMVCLWLWHCGRGMRLAIPRFACYGLLHLGFPLHVYCAHNLSGIRSELSGVACRSLSAACFPHSPAMGCAVWPCCLRCRLLLFRHRGLTTRACLPAWGALASGPYWLLEWALWGRGLDGLPRDSRGVGVLR